MPKKPIALLTPAQVEHRRAQGRKHAELHRQRRRLRQGLVDQPDTALTHRAQMGRGMRPAESSSETATGSTIGRLHHSLAQNDWDIKSEDLSGEESDMSESIKDEDEGGYQRETQDTLTQSHERSAMSQWFDESVGLLIEPKIEEPITINAADCPPSVTASAVVSTLPLARGPTPPLQPERLTNDGIEYQEMWRAAHVTTEAFRHVRTLNGADNYHEWLSEFNTAARVAGFGALVQGRASAPAPLNELDGPEAWNRSLLNHAVWLGWNDSLLGHIQSTVNIFLSGRVDECTTAMEALRMLEYESIPRGPEHAQYAWHALHHTVFDPSEDLDVFLQGFEKRFADLVRMQGRRVLDEYDKCLILVEVLGQPFDEWADRLFCRACVAGVGVGERISFNSLAVRARNEWPLIKRHLERAAPRIDEANLNAHGKRTNAESHHTARGGFGILEMS